jgi:GT2 family glycosyltransferase
MDVSIIIVNYNTSLLLRNCINSIIHFTSDIKFEIIVVDNSSKDDSCKMIRELFPSVTLFVSKTNLGFGRANNKGVELARGKYLLLLNSDTILFNNAIKFFFDFMEQDNNHEIGVCGGNLLKSDMSPNFSYSLYYPSLFSILCYRSHFTFLLNNESFNATNKIKDVAIIIGADLFMRRDLFNEINGFDPKFFMYVEDGDLLYRIKKKNYRIVSNPNVEIIHLQGASSNTIFKYKMEITSYLIYFKKHSNKVTLYMYKIIEFIFLVLKFIISLVLMKKKMAIDYYNLLKYFP